MPFGPGPQAISAPSASPGPAPAVQVRAQNRELTAASPVTNHACAPALTLREIARRRRTSSASAFCDGVSRPAIRVVRIASRPPPAAQRESGSRSVLQRTVAVFPGK